MSEYIRVKKYNANAGFFEKDYPDYDLYVTVPSDLDSKADRSSVDAKIKNVETKISTESSNRENLRQNIEKRLISFENTLTSKVDKNLLDKMKSEILSNDRLTKEKNTLQSLFELLIGRVHKECNDEYNRINQEIQAFKSIDLNKELQIKLQPIDQNLKTLTAIIESTFEALKKVTPLKDTLAANADFQNRLASAKTEINTLVNKYAEERRNIQSIYEDNKNLKLEVNGLRDRMSNLSTDNSKNIERLKALEDWQEAAQKGFKIFFILLIIIGALGIFNFIMCCFH